MKVLITGTHFTPAQALIEELKKYPSIESIYIGRNHTMEGDFTPSIESEVLPKIGVRFIPISAGRLQRQLSIYTLFSLFKIPLGFIQSFYYLVLEKPDLVVSFGGYIGLPVVFASWLLSIPVIIHEQALIPGLANKISSLFAEKIAVAFDKKYPFFSREKIIVTGDPVRKEILDSPKTASPEIEKFISLSKKERLPLLVITGGNQGAHFINELVLKNLNKLTENYFIFHQTGRNKFNDFSILNNQKKNLKFPNRYLVTEWLNPTFLSKLFQNADLVISRAGINTLIEVERFKKPNLIIPLEVGEQIFNAKYFKNMGVSEVLYQKEASDERFLKSIKETIDLKKRSSEELVNKLIVSDGAKRLTQEVLMLLQI